MPATTKPLRHTKIESIAHELLRENGPDRPVVQELRRQIANAFVLYANYKQYHWQTYGPHKTITSNARVKEVSAFWVLYEHSRLRGAAYGISVGQDRGR
jgi:hypothetical protein